ncbi:hypothetical protein [Robertkochia solimangrovi]|uniref:hypothetical protein n=1 Tax=Robertkochia solimangrovi TaxID=2213046 RepID=UPI0013A55151|nr:hypothetical protein [Robertkochia solimangrovi]
MRNIKIHIGLLIVLSILISCNAYKNLEKGQSAISFHSAFENDTLNVKVNDSIRLENHKIDMIFEWGISKNSTIYVNGKEFRVAGTFKTTEIIDKELGLKINRTLRFDTILKAKNGRYIDIGANNEDMIIEQRKKIRIVE